MMPRYHTNQAPIFRGLIEQGHKVFCVVQYTGKIENHKDVDPIVMKPSFITNCYKKYISFKFRNQPSLIENKMGSNYIPSIRFTFDILRKTKPDIVILRERSKASMIFSLLSRISGIKKVIIYNQSPYFRTSKESSMKKWIKKKLFSSTSYTPVLYSEYPFKNSTYFTEDGNYFLPFIANTNESSFANKKYIADDKVRILDVGKYRSYKNHFVLVEAIKILADRGICDNYAVSIVGQYENLEEIEYYNKLKTDIERKGLENIITLYKDIPYTEMNELYKKHDIFVLTSRRDLASIVIIEAMANGLLTISTSNNGTASYIEPGVTGDIFKTDDADNLALVLEKYLTSTELIPQIGKAAFHVCKEQYCFDRFYSLFKNMIKEEFDDDIDG